MEYKDFPGYGKPFIVQHCTGFGVMESPFQYAEQDIVGWFDTKEEAEAFSKMMTEKNNPSADRKSSWCNNTYHIHINTLSERGKELLNQFYIQWDELKKKHFENPDKYQTYKMTDGQEITVEKWPLLDDTNYGNNTK